MGKEVLEFKKIKEEAKEKLPENVKIIETPEARFRIIYGVHIKARRPEELGEADALALECLADYTTKESAEEIIAEESDFFYYASIIERAKKQNKPIFLVDILESDAIQLIQQGLTGVELVAGYSLLCSLAKDIRSKQEITRREFLKRSAKGLAGLYFFSHIPEIALGVTDLKVDEKSKRRAIERFLIDLNEKIHPETESTVFTLRNHLMAQKLRTIARELKQSPKRKSEVALVVGPAHIGIERALQKQDKERVVLVDKLLHVPGLKKARDKIATIARLDFNKEQNKWVAEIFKDPHLAPLEKK